jgi:hypothetical protein
VIHSHSPLQLHDGGVKPSYNTSIPYDYSLSTEDTIKSGVSGVFYRQVMTREEAHISGSDRQIMTDSLSLHSLSTGTS